MEMDKEEMVCKEEEGRETGLRKTEEGECKRVSIKGERDGDRKNLELARESKLERDKERGTKVKRKIDLRLWSPCRIQRGNNDN